VARRWSRPLLALQHASREIARGRRSARLVPSGAREIAELMEDVNTMTAELERLENARRVWIAQISHELRTPLAVLRGEIESIEDGARQPTPSVMAGLRDEVLQLGRLVADLHTLSVADLGGLRCNFTAGDAATFLRQSAGRFAPQAQRLGLALQLPTEDHPPLPVRWDFGRIEQLLGNLLANSLRYTDAPGVVRLGWASDGHALTLTVDDSAPGVPADDLPQLFEPLFRVDRARQRGSDHGSGLGLSIVRSIAQAHGGSVVASPSALGGLRMVVSLPLDARDRPGASA
jgi:two-component system sensor histidine kinase BaeS